VITWRDDDDDDDDILKFNVIQAVTKTTAKTHAWPEGHRSLVPGAYLIYRVSAILASARNPVWVR
jgi:hypothetical protein